MRLPPLCKQLFKGTFCGKYTEVEIFFKEQQNQTVKSSLLSQQQYDFSD